jgi:hypothetical protein
MSLLAAAIVDILKHIIIVIVIILAACFLALHRCVAHGMRFQGFDPGGIIEVPLVMCLFFFGGDRSLAGVFTAPFEIKSG